MNREFLYGDQVIDAINNTPSFLILIFFAEWCKHCNGYEEVIDQLTEDAKCRVVWIDIDKGGNSSLISALDIRGVPTIIKYHSGVLVDVLVGKKTEEQYRKFLFGETNV